MLEADELSEEAESVMTNEDDSKMRSMPLQADPCLDKHCGAGRVCKVCSHSIYNFDQTQNSK